MTELPIDPGLSVYALIERTQTDRLLLNHHATMLVASRTLEDAILVDRARARVFAGFQRMSRFLKQVDRYRQLAAAAESITVFGVMDADPPAIDRVQYVPLKESDQLAKEWFMVADCPEFFGLLAAEEISESGTTGGQRTFWGLWSYDDALVTPVQEQLSAVVGAPPLTNVKHNYRQQLNLISKSMFRLSQQLTLLMTEPTPMSGLVAREIKLMLDQYVVPGVQAASAKLNG